MANATLCTCVTYYVIQDTNGHICTSTYMYNQKTYVLHTSCFFILLCFVPLAHARSHTHAHTHSRTRTHAHTHSRTHAYTLTGLRHDELCPGKTKLLEYKCGACRRIVCASGCKSCAWCRCAIVRYILLAFCFECMGCAVELI